MRTILGLLLSSGLALTAIVVWQMGTERIERSDLAAVGLRFPRDLDEASIEAFIDGLRGLLPPRWRRWQESPTVIFEVHADREGITHRLLTSKRHVPIVENLLKAHLGSVRFEQVDTDEPVVEIAAEYRLSNQHRMLRVDAASLSAQILSSLWPLQYDERVVMQWMITPAAPPTPPRTAGPNDRPLSMLRLSSASPVIGSPGEVAAAKEKQKSPLFLAVARIGVAGGFLRSQRRILHRVESTLYSTTAPGVQIHRRTISEASVAARLRSRKAPLNLWPMQLNTTELTAAIGWPIGDRVTAGLERSGCRPLSIPPQVPSVGGVIGDGAEAGRARPAAMDLEARLRHLSVDGPTGTGKTTLMSNLVAHDLAQGWGMLLVDPKQDFAEQSMGLVPPERAGEVVVIDPSDSEWPVGFNPLRPHGIDPELAVEHLVSIFHRLWSASWGTRSDDLWRAALRTLIVDPDATLLDVGLMLTDRAFRRRLTDKVRDPMLKVFWRGFESMSDGERAQVTGPVMNKWRAVFGRPGLRRIFGQAHPTFDLGEVINSGGIVLVPLNSGTVGYDAANMLAALLIGTAWTVIQGRANQAAASRHPVMVHLDEFPQYAALPVPFDEMLAQARSYRVGITVATQYLSKVPRELMHSLLSNPRSRVTFQLPLAEAKILAPEFGSGLAPDDLQNLGAYEVVARLHAAGHTQAACTLTTRPAPEPLSDPAEIRELSRRRWGADGAAVDRAIDERLNGTTTSPDEPESGPTGRKRRSP